MTNNATIQLENEIAIAKQKIEEHAAQRRDALAKTTALERAVRRAQDALAELEAKKTFFTGRREELHSQLLLLWGKPKSDVSLQVGFDPIQGIAESMGTIAAIDAALLDAPRAKKYLDEQLRIAQRALADHNSRVTTNE